MEDILLRSRRDLESCKHHGKILARSWQDLVNLGKISPTSARSRQSRRKSCKRNHRCCSFSLFRNLLYISLTRLFFKNLDKLKETSPFRRRLPATAQKIHIFKPVCNENLQHQYLNNSLYLARNILGHLSVDNICSEKRTVF